jgi:hypothetical protein
MIEKLIFLLEKESSFNGKKQFFSFKAHNFGPFSNNVYESVEFLEGCELIDSRKETCASPYAAAAEENKLLSEISDDESGWTGTEIHYSLTENGRKVSQIIRKKIAHKNQSDIEEVDKIILKYGTRPLNHLIRYIYRQYPEMSNLQ